MESKKIEQFLVEELGYDPISNTAHIYGDIEVTTLTALNIFFNSYVEPNGIAKVYITSYGGDLYSAFGIVDLMSNVLKVKGIKTDVIVAGPAFSAATLIAVMATGTRLITANSYLMIHDIREGEPQAMTAGAIQHKSKYIAEIQHRYLSLIASKSKYTLKDLKTVVKEDSFLNAKQSVKRGLVDKIL